MNNSIELSKESIQARFESLFQDIVLGKNSEQNWKQADVIFRNGKASDSFQDVEFLMACDQNGSSLLYSSQSQGNSVYSVISGGAKVSFTIR